MGWADDDGLYLNMESAFKAAQQMGTDTNRLTIGPRTLVKRLSEYGLLVSKDTERGKHTIRKVLAGSRRTVIHLAIDTLLVRAHRAHGAHEAHHADEMPGRGPEPWARNERLDTRPGPSSGPPVVPGVPVAAGRGPHGPEGPEVAGETGERSLDEGWGEL